MFKKEGVKEGDQVEIVARKHGHCFDIGELVEIVKVEREADNNGEGGSYRARSYKTGDKWWLSAHEFEVVSVDESEVTAAIQSILRAQP